MVMLRRLNVVLAKIESAYGQDSNPDAANNAILTGLPDVKFNGEIVDRELVKNNFSPMGHTIGKKTIELTFDAELKGSGAAGTPPSIGPLLRACGLSETINAGTSVVYAPVSTNQESCTIYTYIHNILVKILGCRGTLDIIAECGKKGYIRFTMKGLFQGPVDGTLPGSVTYSAIQPPVIVGANFSLGGESRVISKLEAGMNNEVIERSSVSAAHGIASIEIVNRKAAGSIDPEAVSIATQDFWTEWKDGTLKAISLSVGTTGNKVTIDIPKAQYREVGFADKEGVLTMGLPFDCVQDSGDDELTLTYE